MKPIYNYICVIVILIILCCYYCMVYMKQRELFDNYLYPIKGLQHQCKKYDAKPAYMPTTCYLKDGSYNPYSNCMCIGDDGFCKVCYKPLEKYFDQPYLIYSGDAQQPYMSSTPTNDINLTKPAVMEIDTEVIAPKPYSSCMN